MNRKRKGKVDFLVLIMTLSICLGFLNKAEAQKGGIPLADEYYKAGEYAKAKSIYQNFTSDLENAKKIYPSYIDCLLKLEEFDAAEKLFKKLIKWQPENLYYKVDFADYFVKRKKQPEAKKQFEKVLAFTREFPEQTSLTAQYLTKLGYSEVAKQVYLQGRKLSRNEVEYSLELAEIYKIEKNAPEMLRELIHVLLLNQNDKEFLKSKFQDYITTQAEFDQFEMEVLTRIQDDPTQYLYYDLLIWIYLQQRQFEKAFVQAKAYDRLLKLDGSKLMEVAKLAFESKDFEIAAKIYEFVTKNYVQSANYIIARKLKIQSKEEIVKTIFPIENAKIRSLISDYQQLIEEKGRNRDTYDAIRNMALLYGFYLDSKDTATILLESIIKGQWVDAQFQAKCKLDLGDIYVMKNEPWEATLIYSQVEKAQKDQPLGNEAKLKNARLAYFTGQFEFAKDHLDVLKLATHREIANDAMDLSLFIQDNISADLDSTHPGLQAYAKVELLMFQNKYFEALNTLDTILVKYKGSSLVDDVYFLKAKILKKMGKFDLAVVQLQNLGDNFKFDIYGDDAAFLMANIYEESLKNPAKAMELYNQFLKDYPASIYSVEARKRFRQLRGDVLN